MVFALGGCNAKQIQAYVDKITGQHEEIVEDKLPQKNVTDYSDALEGVGEMVKLFDKRPIFVAVEPINNHTAASGALPGNIQILVESSLNKMGNGRITIIPYTEAAIARYEKQNLYIVHGAITEFDASIKSGSGGGGAAVFGTAGSTDFDAEGNRGNSYSVSSISLDFTLQDVRTAKYIPGLQISNKMEITQISQSEGYGFSIYGNGINVDASATIKQGVHSVIRLLVELSMAELIGQLYEVPYWLAVYDAKDFDESMLAKMKNDFNRASPKSKAKHIQRLLAYINDTPLKVDGIIGNRTKGAIRDFKAGYGLAPVDDKIDDILYEACLRTTSDKLRQSIQ